MRNIAIVEDDDKEAGLLEEQLRRYEKETGAEYRVVRFSDAIAFLTGYSADYDIVFMDIEMPDLDGMTAAKKLREVDPEVILVFVTNMAQYAVEGYEVSAMDFMVKPVRYDNLKLKLERAEKKLEGKGEDRFLVRGKNGPVVICVPDIRYVEVTDHMLTFYTNEGAIKVTGSLKEIEKRLEGRDFSRANSCYLVNLKYVTGASDGMVTVGGDRLSISRARRKSFMSDLADYLGGRV
ncbi:MAG TPA: LytTR family DNA-binding domain-containing protein [Firmicutes bacterium]|mgnify:FL=1|jgi:hypothetical protein|nr:LytTR family DNA-binding domain-containing protein [Bacillota bacterium]